MKEKQAAVVTPFCSSLAFGFQRYTQDRFFLGIVASSFKNQILIRILGFVAVLSFSYKKMIVGNVICWIECWVFSLRTHSGKREWIAYEHITLDCTESDN